MLKTYRCVPEVDRILESTREDTRFRGDFPGKDENVFLMKIKINQLEILNFVYITKPAVIAKPIHIG